jgi:hypothetical protein
VVITEVGVEEEVEITIYEECLALVEGRECSKSNKQRSSNVPKV